MFKCARSRSVKATEYTQKYTKIHKTQSLHISPNQINYLSMSYLGVLHHDVSHRLFIYGLCLLGAVCILSAAYADPQVLPSINQRSQFELNEGNDSGIEVLGASGVTLLFESTQVTQQSTVTATLYGYPYSDYYVWFVDTKKMTGEYGDQPPQFSPNQDEISHDPQNGPYSIGSYVYSQGRGASIQEDVAGSPSHGVLYYAQVRTGSNGQATITFVMSSGTKPGLYTVRAERFTQGQYEIAYVPIEVFEKQGGMALITERKVFSLGDDIVLTFTGRPLKYYTIWVMNTGSMSGGPQDQPPLLLSDQENVWRDPASGPYEIGQYRCATCRGDTLQQSVSKQPDSGTRYYARVLTDEHGFGTVTFSSTNLIKPQEYTFHIEEPFAAVQNSAEVTIQIQSNSSPTPGLSLCVDQASVTQGEQFYAELWGTPKTPYYLWFFNTSIMDGTFGHQPPSISEAQTQMSHDPIPGPYTIGNYQYDGGNGDTIRNNIAIDSEYRGTYYYGVIETDAFGYGKVEFHTDAGTEPKTYRLRAEFPRLMDEITYEESFAETEVMIKTTTESLTITPESEHVILGSSSYCIITGLPNTEYYLWFYKTEHMSGYPGEQPPTFQENQKQFLQDPAPGPYTIGRYVYAGACCGRAIKNDVPSRPDSGVRYYGLVKTDEMGRAVIGFDTEYMVTKPGNYQIHVERNTGYEYQKATAVITIGLSVPEGPVPKPWPTPTQAPTSPSPVPTPTSPPSGKLMLTTDTSMLNSGETAIVTLSGQPLTEYYFWVSDTAHISGFYGDQPPVIPSDQQGIFQDKAHNIIIGKHPIEGKGAMTIHDDVPLYPDNGTCYYALVTTDRDGVAQIRLQAPQGVRPQPYTLRAERTELLTQAEIATAFVTATGASSPELILTVQPRASSLGTVFRAHLNGMPLTTYYLWISGTHGMSGMQGDQPPLIQPQPGIVQDGAAGPFFIGDYHYLGGNEKGIRDDVPIQPESGVLYYAQIKTDEQGQAFLLLTSSSDTKPGEYTLTAELPLIRGAGEENSTESAEFESERHSSRTAAAQFSVDSTVSDQFLLQLLPGWNFISIPGVPAQGSDTFAVFSDVDTQGRSIWTYDLGKWPDTQGWNMRIMYDKLEPLDGYWIYSTSPMTILIPISESTPMNTESYISRYAKQMYPGWNAIGLSGQYPRSAKDALVSIDNDWTITLGYDNALHRYDTAIIHGGADDYADNRFMQPGAGYWIYMQNPGTLFG